MYIRRERRMLTSTGGKKSALHMEDDLQEAGLEHVGPVPRGNMLNILRKKNIEVDKRLNDELLKR
eukprot:TRINITY_DN4966_c0_g1_i1.p3 TRINITY_DN4966_c0_g1~~TRINITY_DN4966_c0_g1_i1.p3  ORF type:complete len:65 (-),score=7.15 TRINITY_DN4966_c0_g1_i1:107-301(-)